MYKVEKILDKKISEGEVRYLIKWQGWSKKESTWEPLDNLSNILSMINEFEVNKTGKTAVRGSKKIEEKNSESSKQSSESEPSSEEKSKESSGSSKGQSNHPKEVIDLEEIPTEFLKKKRAAKKLKEPTLVRSSMMEVKPFKKDNPKPQKKEKSEKAEKKAKTNKQNLDKSSQSEKSSSSSLSEKTDSANPTPEKEKLPVKQTLPSINQGNLDCDIPSKIISARMSSNGEVLCVIEWKKRYDGSVPENSLISNKVLKSSHPGLLLDYYESRLRDNRCQKLPHN